MSEEHAGAPPPLPAAGGRMGGAAFLAVEHRRVPSRPGPRDRREAVIWYAEDVGGGWRVAYRLLPQDGELVLAEVRVLPAEDGRRRDEWSGEPGAVPRGGLPEAVLARVRAALPLDRAQAAFEGMTRGHEALGSMQFAAPLWERTPGERRRTADQRRLAQVVAVYARHVRAGHRAPTRATAEEMHLSAGYASKLVGRARDRGLLTATVPGRAGGDLTAKARELLA